MKFSYMSLILDKSANNLIVIRVVKYEEELEIKGCYKEEESTKAISQLLEKNGSIGII